MAFRLSSSAFADGARIPVRYTCEGEDISPPLAWSGTPVGTLSLALLCDDPDAPGGTWRHWALFDIPADTQSLAEGLPKDERVGAMRQGMTDFRRIGFGGPCPPPGHGVHHYHFRLLALSVDRLDLMAQPRFEAVEQAARQHLLAEARLVGTYSR
jgi:Raf kinase inhibitor-like YbhB/YbcL family protein